jgi:tetratricopeptide (TPR) repeat protein
MPPDVVLEGMPPAVQTAISDAFAAARENNKDPEKLATLGYTLHAHAQYAGAAAAYERAIHFQPSFDLIYARAIALELIGRNDEAIAGYTAALKLKPDHVNARLRLAERQLDGNFISNAAREFRGVLDRDSSNPRAHYGLGRCYQAEKQFDRANGEFDRALASYPAYGAAHYALGQFFQRRGEGLLAQQHLDKHREFALVAPAIVDEIDLKIQSYNAGAIALIRKSAEMAQVGNITRAIELLQEAVKLEPSQVQAHVNLLILLAKERRYFDAEQHFRRAVQLAPNRADAFYNYGVMRFVEKKYEDSCRAFQHAVDINPKYAEALTNLGFCEENFNRPDEAFRRFQAAHEAKPAYRLGTFHYARMLAMRNRVNEAIPLLESVQTPVDKDTPGYAMALGTAYQQARRTDDARRQWQRTVSLAQSLNQPAIETQAKALLARVR